MVKEGKVRASLSKGCEIEQPFSNFNLVYTGKVHQALMVCRCRSMTRNICKVESETKGGYSCKVESEIKGGYSWFNY